jgi:hypothetical protein
VAFDRGLIYPIGDALVGLIDWAWPRIGSRIDDLLGKAGDVLRPDPPISIRTLHGELLTGLIVADRGQVLLFVGTRTAPPSSVHSERRDPASPRYPGDGIPLWSRDVEVDPYRRS